MTGTAMAGSRSHGAEQLQAGLCDKKLEELGQLNALRDQLQA